MINPFEYNDEIYKCINLYGIQPRYLISNYGTIIDTTTNTQIQQHLTNDGYARVSLKTIDGGYKWFLVHRLVMMIFHPITNPELFEVDHLYGNKLDNNDTKLEWVTGAENLRRAVNNGLLDNNGEKSAKSILTEQVVRKICELLESNVPTKVIVSIIGDVGVLDLRREIDGIRSHKCWTSISKDYDIDRDKNDRNSFSDIQVHHICKLLEDGYGYKDILISLGYDIDSMSSIELEKYCNIISNIRIGRYYKDISKNYNVNNSCKSRHDQRFTNNQIHDICKRFENGESVDSILLSFNISKESVSISEYNAYKRLLKDIFKKKKFTNISCNYNF